MKGSLEKDMCVWCASSRLQRKEIIQKKGPFIPHKLSVSLKMALGLHTETLWCNLSHGKGADDTSDNRQVTGLGGGGTERC